MEPAMVDPVTMESADMGPLETEPTDMGTADMALLEDWINWDLLC